MKTKAILATLLVAAAASADARFASPFPRKAVPPDESGHWIVINGNPWSHADDPQPKSITPDVGFGVSPSVCSRQVFHSLERKVDRPLRRAMLKGKAAKPLTMSSAK